ncbi:hypothetical protein [Falsiroseomonas sp. CW058]|uniref:hypothetical protein n=1 Tax=Falsiroseomonas sp. CW058 TaxID=3388664 RepID=UPI003D319C69
MNALPRGFVGFVSDHRFRIVLGACVLVLGLMVVVIHATIGLGPPWGTAVPTPA